MAHEPTQYQRLPGRGAGLVSFHRLYLGPDHLLLVTSTGYSETYRRFYFRDIQAIVLQKTAAWAVWNGVLGSLSALCALLVTVYLIGRAPEMMVPLVLGLVLAPFSVVPLVWNLLLGPTCVCLLGTAVQTTKMPTLGRLRTARRVVARIKPLIEAVQGPLPPDALRELEARKPAPPAVAAPPVIAAAGLPPRAYNGRVHAWLCWLLLADLPATVLDYFFETAGRALGLTVFAATGVAAVIALVRQRQASLPRALKRMPWIVLGLFGGSLAVGNVYGVVLLMQGRMADAQDLRVWEEPFLFGMAVVTTAIAVMLGAYGLVRLRNWRASEAPTTAASGGPPPLLPES